MSLNSVGVCGAGYWGRNHVRQFRELGALKAVCDKRPEVLKYFSSAYPDVKACASYPDLLRDSSIRSIVLAVPTPEHYRMAKQALLAGKHVFVEKPLALKVEHARELCRLAKTKRLKLMVGHLLLYHPAVCKLKEMVENNELGDLYYLYTQRLNLGQIRKDENVLWSLAPHDISVLIELFAESPVSVSASGQCFIQKKKKIEDVVFIELRFKRNRSAYLHLSWLDPHKVRRITLVGSKKMVVFDDMETTDKIKIYDRGVDESANITASSLVSSMVLRLGDVHIPHLQNIEPLKAECRHFLDCLQKDIEPRSNGENGLKVLEIMNAASVSLRSGGRKIRL